MKKGLAYILTMLLFSMSAWAETTANVMIRGKRQELHLYGTQGRPPVILSSGDLGWAGLVVHVAEFLASNNYFVVGLNSKAYLASFTTKSSALDPQDVPKDYLTLIEFAKQSSPTRPVLAGISE